MQTLWTFTKAAPCALALFLCGCWMGGQSRSNSVPTPAPASSPPVINTPQYNAPQYGPSAPWPPAQSVPPALDGPVIEGPAFPQSTEEPPTRFQRKRHSQKWPNEESHSNYAGSAPPILSDGPIATKPVPEPQRIGYIELPPAP